MEKSSSRYTGAASAVYLAMVLMGTSNVMFSATKEHLMEAYGIGLREIGFLLTFRGVINGVLPVFSGAMSDRIGRKKIILAGSLMLLAYYALTPVFSSYYVLLLMIAFLSAAVAFVDPISQSVLFDVFEDPTKMMPFIQVAFSAGSLTAPILISAMIDMGISWGISYYFYAFLIVLFIIFIFICRFPPLRVELPKKEKDTGSEIGNGIADTEPFFKKKPYFKKEGLAICVQVTLTCIAAAIMSNWIDVYMRDVFNFSHSWSVRVISFYQMGCMSGAFLTYYLAKKLHSTRIANLYLLAALIVYPLALLQENGVLFIVFIVLTGAVLGTQFSLSVGLLGTLFRSNSGLSTGVIGSCSAFAMAISSSFAGRYVDVLGIRAIFIILNAVFALAFIMSLVVRRLYDKLVN